jgi:DNA-binding HxlR family transcriptional regulator
MSGISPRILSKELEGLLQNEIISRIVMNPKLVSVEYELTEHGETLESVISSISDWGAEHFKHLHT